MYKRLGIVILTAAIAGCAQQMVYPGAGDIGKATKLGPVQACKGGGCCYESEGRNRCEWPLAMKSPPAEFDVQYALKQDAAKRYQVQADKVALDVIDIKVTAEIDGTVRGWSASSVAGVVP